MARKNVPASAVRDWFAQNTPEGVPVPGSRGRLHPDTIAAFHKANPRLRYETGSEAQKPTVTVPVTMVDKAGRKTTRKVTITTEAARDLLGHPKGRKGRFALSDLSLALEAQHAAEVADTFATAA